MLSRRLAIATVILVGIAITALELAAARLMAPFFGSTIFVYGSAIGIVLTALAIGYWLGGRVADQRPSRAILSLIITVAGLSAACIPVSFRAVAASVDAIGASRGVPVGILVVVSMAVLFTIPIVALGSVSPFALRLSLRAVNESGRWSGLLSGASTFGSILGTFLATFITIPLLGTRQTILLAAGILILLGFVLAPFRLRSRVLPCALFLVLAAWGATGPFLARPGLAWERESPYQLVQVLKSQGANYLITDAGDGAQSIYRPETAYTMTIYDAFSLLPFLSQRDGRERSVLVIGLAGGTMVRLYEKTLADRFDFDVIGVEIDGSVLEAGRQFFGLNDLKMEIVNDDARRFLERTDQSYDVIIVDAFVHELQIPPLLATQEFFSLIRDHLAAGGIVGMNVISSSGNRFFPKFLNTVASVFPEVATAPFIPGAVNQLVLASNDIRLDALPQSIAPEVDRYLEETVPTMRTVVREGEDVYTDDRTDIELRMRSSHAR